MELQLEPASRDDIASFQGDDQSGEYYLVTTKDGELVGRLDVPTAFCAYDHSACPMGEPSFHVENGWWIHMGCEQPTRAWWDAHFRSMVDVANEQLILW